MAGKVKKVKNHYVNNKDLFAAMCAFKDSVKKAEEEETLRPRVPMYVGESIMKIATHLAFRPNFSNYTFREEMISDGIENCLQYIDNFDPEKSKNPFAYFTQIIYYAFVRRIQKEKKYLYTKYAAIERANIMDETADLHESEKGSGVRYASDIQYGEWGQEQMENFMQDFEQSRRRKRKKKAPKGSDNK